MPLANPYLHRRHQRVPVGELNRPKRRAVPGCRCASWRFVANRGSRRSTPTELAFSRAEASRVAAPGVRTWQRSTSLAGATNSVIPRRVFERHGSRKPASSVVSITVIKWRERRRTTGGSEEGDPNDSLTIQMPDDAFDVGGKTSLRTEHSRNISLRAILVKRAVKTYINRDTHAEVATIFTRSGEGGGGGGGRAAGRCGVPLGRACSRDSASRALAIRRVRAGGPRAAQTQRPVPYRTSSSGSKKPEASEQLDEQCEGEQRAWCKQTELDSSVSQLPGSNRHHPGGVQTVMMLG